MLKFNRPSSAPSSRKQQRSKSNERNRKALRTGIFPFIFLQFRVKKSRIGKIVNRSFQRALPFKAQEKRHLPSSFGQRTNLLPTRSCHLRRWFWRRTELARAARPLRPMQQTRHGGDEMHRAQRELSQKLPELCRLWRKFIEVCFLILNTAGGGLFRDSREDIDLFWFSEIQFLNWEGIEIHLQKFAKQMSF